jgi:hypothetical protein
MQLLLQGTAQVREALLCCCAELSRVRVVHAAVGCRPFRTCWPGCVPQCHSVRMVHASAGTVGWGARS